MKKTTLSVFVLLVLFIGQMPAQTNANVSIFNRLLIFNSKNELLVVKVKKGNDWFTPGFYQDDKVLLREGLNNSAAAFGLSISEPSLQGMFILKRRDRKELGYRNMYFATTKDKVSKMPESVEKVKWVSIGKTNQLTTFPQTDILIRQVASYPKTVWGGSLASFKEDGKIKIEMLEDFYPLFNNKKKGK